MIEDNLELPQGDIDWFLRQVEKSNEQLFKSENIPVEYIGPMAYPAPLLATPAPMASVPLPAEQPPSPLSTLTPSPVVKTNSPLISELATLVVHTFSVHETPKPIAMDISPPALPTTFKAPSPPSTDESIPVMPLIQDVQMNEEQQPCMNEEQQARVTEVLAHYQKQEIEVLKMLHATRQ